MGDQSFGFGTPIVPITSRTSPPFSLTVAIRLARSPTRTTTSALRVPEVSLVTVARTLTRPEQVLQGRSGVIWTGARSIWSA